MLEKVDTTKKTYINIVGGKFAVKCTKETQGAVKRFSEKKKEDVYELVYGQLTSLISEIKIEKTDYGKVLTILTKDNEVISIPVDSKYFDSFCSKIGNANISKEIKISPYSFVSEGKRITGINLYQDGKKLNYFFTKDDPKGKPFSGESKLDESDWKIFKLTERKFFCDYIDSFNNAGF